jgi:hypothetical protein
LLSSIVHFAHAPKTMPTAGRDLPFSPFSLFLKYQHVSCRQGIETPKITPKRKKQARFMYCGKDRAKIFSSCGFFLRKKKFSPQA